MKGTASSPETGSGEEAGADREVRGGAEGSRRRRSGGGQKRPRLESSEHRAGFVALVGLPAAGKSTLLNRLVGQRLAIVTGKPQTTRRRILGIVRRPGLECIVLDTPGVHRPRNALGRAMMRAVSESLGGSDAVLLVVDGTRRFTRESAGLFRRIAAFRGARIVGINKTDRARAARVRELTATYRERGADLVVAFSARTGANVERPPAGSPGRGGGAGPLLSALAERLPLGPPLYEEDRITDLPEAFFASEIVRERMLVNLHQEVPHTAAVRIEEYDDSGDPVRITASVLLDRKSQRGIVIGRRGRMVRRIGTEARLAIQERLGRRVFLGLTVKVRQGWRDNPGILKNLGLA